MKRFFSILIALAMLAGSALYIFWPRLTALRAQSPFEAAKILEDALQDEQEEITFRSEDIDLDEVYAALESICPYAFSLHAVTRANNTTTLSIDISRPARQQQAWEYAQQLVQSWVTPDMDTPDRLRALHDGLVRLCEYDTETASRAPTDGATAPFAADGALLDHKAVCAGYGRAFGMLCDAAGIQAVYVASEEMNHGWNAVRLDGITYFIDCTFDDPVPDRGEYVSDSYFLCTTEELAKTHDWDKQFYEQLLDHLTE